MEEIQQSVERVLATLIQKSMRAGIIPAFAAGVAVLSCSSPTDPLSDISAVVVPETIAQNVESTSGRVDVSLRFRITNPTSGPVYYSACSAGLERQNGTRWEHVASTICLAYLSADPLERTREIPAGESGEVGAFMSGYGENGLTTRLPEGTYRVHFSVLSTLPVVWQGTTGIQYRGSSHTTSGFALTGAN